MKNIKKKGFTLIELIVVIAIIGILILLAAPKYKEYTEQARLTEVKVNIKELEKASSKYYMTYNNWPRESDVPYTAQQLEEYSKNILDKTGKVVVLQENGSYYDIDYNKISNYIKEPRYKGNYILQNPVGSIFYMEGMTEEGKQELVRTRKNKGGIVSIKDYDNSEVIFSGLSEKAFDGDLSTYHPGLGTLTWEGDLTDKEIEITGAGSNSTPKTQLRLDFRDENGNIVRAVGENSDTIIVSGDGSIRSRRVVVPEGAVEVRFYQNSWVKIHEVKVIGSYTRPHNIEVTSETSTSSITLNWNYPRAIIYKDGVLLGDILGTTYTDKPLYSNTEHTYEIYVFSEDGNGRLVRYRDTTDSQGVDFRGLTPSAFDGDISTFKSGENSMEISWIGDLSKREIQITAQGSNSTPASPVNIRFKDINGNIIKPLGFNTDTVLITPNGNLMTKKVIVPDGAIKIEVLGNGWTKIIDVQLPHKQQVTRPNNVRITSTSTTSSITLNWNYPRAIIYKDGMLLGDIVGGTYTDKPLYSNSKHTYEIYVFDEMGNGVKGNGVKEIYTAETLKPEIEFRGFTPHIFDGDLETFHVGVGTGLVTWTGDLSNKKLEITGQGSNSTPASPVNIRFKDINGLIVRVVGSSSDNFLITPNGTKLTKVVTVPNGAVSMEVLGNGWTKIFEMQVVN